MKQYHLKESLLFAGIPAEQYQKYEKEIRVCNVSSLRNLCLLGAVIYLVLLVASFFSAEIGNSTYTYGGILLASLILLLLCLCKPQFVEKRINLLYPMAMVLVFALAIRMGTFENRELTASAINIVIILLPMLFLDKPYKHALIVSAAVAAFVIICFCIKPVEVATIDAINAIGCGFASALESNYIIRTKMGELIEHSEVQQQRDTDSLTGLHNRRSAERFISECLREDVCQAAMLLDIDGFKKINDTFGHKKGDEVLVETARILRLFFAEDVNRSRLGGDEFMIFFPQAERTEEIVQLAESLLKQLHRSVEQDGKQCPVSCSIGIAIKAVGSAASYDELYWQADQAMYQAKETGKNQCRIYHS